MMIMDVSFMIIYMNILMVFMLVRMLLVKDCRRNDVV